ncbi:hypothetical protein UZ36_04165 [Candidatus Nitromaritima sp. SCGC AAA799-C22]|nr:hypothetical protein UZ36_04165 [Candidatus Nitromaritima sp. SCGC AAA799-C22]
MVFSEYILEFPDEAAHRVSSKFPSSIGSLADFTFSPEKVNPTSGFYSPWLATTFNMKPCSIPRPLAAGSFI